MPLTPLEQMRYRIMEMEMLLDMHRRLPRDDTRWIPHFENLFEEKLYTLQSCYNALCQQS